MTMAYLVHGLPLVGLLAYLLAAPSILSFGTHAMIPVYIGIIASLGWIIELNTRHRHAINSQVRLSLAWLLIACLCASLYVIGRWGYDCTLSYYNGQQIPTIGAIIAIKATVIYLYESGNLAYILIPLLLPLLFSCLALYRSQWYLFWSPSYRSIVRNEVLKLRTREGSFPPELVRFLSGSKGLTLGIYDGDGLDNRIIRYKADSEKQFVPGHHMVIAGTRAGKGVSCVFPGVLDYDGPVVALDIKGELMIGCRRHRLSLGRRQIVINPFMHEYPSSKINPLDYIRSGPGFQNDISVIADGLIVPTGAEDDWVGKQARQLIEAVIEAVHESDDPRARNLTMVYETIAGEDLDGVFTRWLRSDEFCSCRLVKAARMALDLPDKQRGSIISKIREDLNWLKYEEIAGVLRYDKDSKNPYIEGGIIGASDFTWDELLDGKVDLYISFPTENIKQMQMFMRLFLNISLTAVTRDRTRGADAPKILFVLDEFTRLGKMEEVMNIATIAAASGVEALFVVQDISTLREVYSDHAASTLLGSCATTRVFGLGRADSATAEAIAKVMPITHIEKRISRTTGQDYGSTTEQESTIALLNTAEILELPSEYMICLMRSKQPLILKKITSYAHKDYVRKIDKNPNVRG